MSINPPPNDGTSIYNPNDYNQENASGNNSALTVNDGLQYFVSYPSSQGFETFPSGVSVSSGLRVDNINLSEELFFNDGSKQYTAFYPTNITKGDYTNTNLSVNSQGLITSISNGSTSTTGLTEAEANGLYASLSNENVLSGGNTFENIIVASNGVQYGDNSMQTSAGISETTANTLYVSLTNYNTITGETIFDYSNTNIINELATPTETQGTLINWNATNGGGRTNIINFAQGSNDGGLSLYTVSNTQPVTELYCSSRTQFQLYTPLTFSDTTQQNTAFIPQSVTAGSYTNSNLTVNSQGIITEISNGPSYLTESTADTLYASLTNNNELIGINTFSQSISANQGIIFGDSTVQLTAGYPANQINLYYAGIYSPNVFTDTQTMPLLKFSDATQQNTAYIPQSTTAGSYTNCDLTVNVEILYFLQKKSDDPKDLFR